MTADRVVNPFLWASLPSDIQNRRFLCIEHFVDTGLDIPAVCADIGASLTQDNDAEK
jgi:hypothetical protein